MKKQIEIYDEYKKNIEKRKKLIAQMMLCEQNLSNLQNECSHEIGIMFSDHIPHRVGKIIDCFCPACSKIESIYCGNKLEKTSFKNSKLIDLSECLTINIIDRYAIRDYIFENYDFYYNNTSNEEMEKAIINMMENSKIKTLLPDKNINQYL